MVLLCKWHAQKRKGEQMKIIKDCVIAWLCGFSIGVWLGWFDYMGNIYYSVNDGMRTGLLLGGVFAIVSLWNNLIEGE